MPEPEPELLSARDVVEAEEREALRSICKAFGRAMRHTMLNHKEKSNDAWEEFADLIYDHFQEE